MRYYTIKPSPALVPYVRFFWVLENDVLPGDPFIYRSMADSCTEIIFHYKGAFEELTDNGKEPQSFSLVHSQTDRYREFITKDSFGIFGAYLYPFAVPLIFSFPSTDFRNRMIPLGALLKKEYGELEEKIMCAADSSTRVKILSHFLLMKLNRNKDKDTSVHESIKYMVHSQPDKDISQIAGKFNLSLRQFERKFKEYSGFTPQLFSRITRFQSSLKEYGKNRTLTEIAMKCGYYDQSHFNREFKLFSGYLPKEYFICRREDAELRI